MKQLTKKLAKRFVKKFYSLVLFGLLFILMELNARAHNDIFLLSASVKGDVQEVNRLISEGANPNYISDESFSLKTPLIAAIYSGDEPTFFTLLNHGASVVYKDRYFPSLLAFAVDQGQIGMMKELFRRGNDVNIILDDGNNLLSGPISDSKEEVVRTLVSWNINVSFINALQQSLLEKAILVGNESIIQILLEAGAKIEFMDKWGSTNNARDYALRLHLPHVVKLIDKEILKRNSSF